MTLIYAISSKNERHFYVQGTLKNGWSRNILSMQIETNLFKRQGNAVTNFNDKLPSPLSDLARNTLKNPYLFDVRRDGCYKILGPPKIHLENYV